MHERAVDIASLLRGGSDFMLGYERKIMRPRPAFQQILERLTDDRLAIGPEDLAGDPGDC